MKNWLIRIVILLLYSVPYVFLAMNGDANGIMWFYLLMIVAFTVLSLTAKRTGNSLLIVIGNTISFLVSLACVSVFRTEKYGWYFKPFTDVQLLITISVVALVLQLLFGSGGKNKDKGENL